MSEKVDKNLVRMVYEELLERFELPTIPLEFNNNKRVCRRSGSFTYAKRENRETHGNEHITLYTSAIEMICERRRSHLGCKTMEVLAHEVAHYLDYHTHGGAIRKINLTHGLEFQAAYRLTMAEATKIYNEIIQHLKDEEEREYLLEQQYERTEAMTQDEREYEEETKQERRSTIKPTQLSLF